MCDLSNGSVSIHLSDLLPRFQGHGVIFRPIDALNVLCAQLTRDLFAMANFLLLNIILTCMISQELLLNIINVKKLPV